MILLVGEQLVIVQQGWEGKYMLPKYVDARLSLTAEEN